MDGKFYFHKIKDESRLKIDKETYEHDISLKGEFIRLVMASSKTPEEKGILLAELVEKTWCKFESGEMKVKIYKTFPLCEANAAHQVLYRGENIGKVVLIVKE